MTGLAWELLRDLSTGPDRPIAIVGVGRLDAGGAGDGPRVLLTELLHAAPGPRCFDLPPEGHWLATGGGPLPWTAIVGPDGIRLTLGEAPTGLDFPPRKSSLPGPTRTFASATPEHAIQLAFEAKPCRLPEGGGYFHLSVSARLDGRELQGCGLSGADLAPDPTEAAPPAPRPAGRTAAALAPVEAEAPLPEALAAEAGAAIADWTSRRRSGPLAIARLASVDLDGDGAADEAIALTDRCDARGCLLLCLRRGPTGLAAFSATTAVRLPVRLARERSSGLRDLLVGQRTEGVHRLVRLAFDGEAYPADAAQLPTLTPEEVAASTLVLGEPSRR